MQSETIIQKHLSTLHHSFGFTPKQALRFFLEDVPERTQALIQEAPSSDNVHFALIRIILLASLGYKEGKDLVIELDTLEKHLLIDLLEGDFFSVVALALSTLFQEKREDLQEIILSPSLHGMIRSVSVQAMMHLWAKGAISREDLVSLFSTILKERSEKIPYFYDMIAASFFALHPEEVFSLLQEAYREGFIDKKMISLEDLERIYEYPKEAVIENALLHMEKELGDVIKKIETALKEDWLIPVERNDLCPCQSGLKYKKCCL